MVFPGHGISWKEFLGSLKKELKRDKLTDVAGSVTYYGVLALFPFLLFLVALASVLFNPADAEKAVQAMSKVAPGAVTQIIGDRLKSITSSTSVGLLTIGILGTFYSASGGVSALMRALNGVYNVDEGRPWWKTYLVAFGMTIFAAVIAIAAAVAMVGVGPVADKIGGPIGTALYWLRFPVAGALMMFLWAVLYYVLPDVEQDFKFITPGSMIGVVLWLLASWGFSLYVGHFGKYEATYGALGGVIILLLWMYISSLIVLVGAEINAVIEHRSPEGKRTGAKDMADSGPDVPKTEKLEEQGLKPAPTAAPGSTPLPVPKRDRPLPPSRSPRPRLISAPFIAGFLAGVGALAAGLRARRS
jgi:membrane protein